MTTPVILCAHGKLAPALLDSVNMVYGATGPIHPLIFSKGQNADDIMRNMQQIMAQLPPQPWLIAVDLFGGSPYNAAAMLALKNPQLEVITGISLPLCLEIADNQQGMSARQLAVHLTEIGKACVCSLRDLHTCEEEEADFQ
ncbi:mannose/fructose/sorbose PTS transporter subunit IIA [Brenneria sp. g21c3]|uniref:PTS sugar transporter subunit IIA n=1 Tax=Brenneria sp. g21c3 TaxID=3093893 RepID=UPI002EC520C5|nr:mannose/fructose/sorbose PTS transporter subunit IIA [Brenneria sp. g21c3]